MPGTNPTSKPVIPKMTQNGAAYPANIDAAINALARPGFAFAPSEADIPNMTVRLEAGSILSGVTLTEVAAQNTATIAAPTTNPRIDRVVIDRSTGAVSVVEGTEAASPSAPAIPSGKLPVGQVLIAVGQTSITNADLTDERVGGSSVAIAQDLSAPSAVEVPSTQAVQDALDAAADAFARDLAMMTAMLAWRSHAKASGPIPLGCLWTFQTDELAVKTGATHDGSGKRYGSTVTGSGDIVPTLSGYTGGGFTVSASSEYAGSTAAWCLFNETGGSANGSNVGWMAAGSTGSVKVDCGSAREISGYSITANSDLAARQPANFVLEGSNTGAFAGEQTTLDTQTSQSWSAGQKRTYMLPSNATHRYHRLNVTANNGDTNLAFAEMELLGVASISNMTLRPTAITADSAPASASLYLLHSPVDAVTLGTDIKVRASRDGGSTWSAYATLTTLCAFDAATDLLKATADLTTATSGTSVLWEITTYNTKQQSLAAVGMVLD